MSAKDKELSKALYAKKPWNAAKMIHHEFTLTLTLIQLQARDTLLITASLKQVMVMVPYLQPMVQ